ncbi:MAG TPA: ROK family transcriptional regulator [Streptosporangiaceae bacterium]
MNEQLLLGHIRQLGPCSRADLARLSGLSKPTVSLALATVERAGLIRVAGQQTGRPGRSAQLYEVRPDVGYVLGLDVGAQYLRGAVADLAGAVRARGAARLHASSVRGRIDDLVQLAVSLCAEAGLERSAVAQAVIGSPGVYDPQRNAMALTGRPPGWERPEVMTWLREEFGSTLVVENDINAAALAEQADGHGRDVASFAFVSVGTGIGMGLVIGGQLVRGRHGAAGEIAYIPMTGGHGLGASADGAEPGTGSPPSASASASAPSASASASDWRGALENASSAAAVVRSARRAGLRGQVSARSVFQAAARGDDRAAAVVADEARLVARMLCTVVSVIDPELIVLGGGIGQAPGFADAVIAELEPMAPVLPDVRVSALGTEAVADGCLAAATELAWARLSAISPPPPRPAWGWPLTATAPA